MQMSDLLSLPSKSASWLSLEVTTRPFTIVSDLTWLSASTRTPLVLGVSDSNDHTSELYTYLDPARRLLWFYRSIHLLVRAVLLATIGLLALSLLRLFGFTVPTTWEQGILAIIAFWVVVLIVGQRLRYFDVARVVDRNLNLNAQLGTAVELIQRPQYSPLARSQIHKATSYARDLKPLEMISFRWPVRDLRALGVTGALLVAVNVVSNLGLTSPLASESVSVPAGEYYEEMDPSLAGWSELSPEDLAQLQGTIQGSTEMQDLVAELNELLRTQAITPEEYAARLAEAEAALRERADTSAKTQAALSELADALRDTSSTREVAEALNRGDYDQAAQGLSELGAQTSMLSPQARQELADALQDAAQRTSELSPELSRQAQQASDALSSGDPQTAQRALQSLADAINQANQQIAPQSELGEQLSQLQPDGSMGIPGSEYEQFGDTSGVAEDGMEGMMPGSEGNPPGEGAPGQQAGGGDETAQPRDASGGGAGAGRESTTGQSNSGRALGVDATEKTLRLQGKPSDPGTAQRNQGPQDTPRTSSSEGTLELNAQSGSARSTEAVDAYGESNYVPFDLRPIVRGFFSGDKEP